MRQPTRAGQAAKLAATAQRVIETAGQDITLPDKTTLRAVKDDNQYKVSRYISTEGLNPSIKSPVVLQFAGSLHGTGILEGRPELVIDGLKYRIYSLHPQIYENVCVELVAVAAKP